MLKMSYKSSVEGREGGREGGRREEVRVGGGREGKRDGEENGKREGGRTDLKLCTIISLRLTYEVDVPICAHHSGRHKGFQGASPLKSQHIS